MTVANEQLRVGSNDGLIRDPHHDTMRNAMLFLLFGLSLGTPTRASDIPVCTPAQDGRLACLSGRLCSCRLIRGGSITGQRDRHAWDCGILRPVCGMGLVPPSIPDRDGTLLLRPNRSATPNHWTGKR